MSGAGETKAEPRIAQTLDRGLEVLHHLSEHPEGLSTAALAAHLDVHRSIIHRLVATLERRALVARSTGGTYVLGLGLVALAASVSTDLRVVARPYLDELAELTGETIHLVVRDGWDVLFLDGVESTRALRVATRVGRRLPAHATSVGKALLAQMALVDRTALYRKRLPSLTPETIAERSTLEAELAAIAARGYATNHGESEESVGSVGIAIAGSSQLAISIAAPTARLGDEVVERYAALLRSSAERLARELG